MNIDFRTLTKNEIEVRPTNTKYKGKASLLLYIDSRAAANILNETIGNFNWSIDYKEVAGKVYGTLSIWDSEKQQWVGKTDTGSESNIEADKGQASDILKRCLARWGCDYLYSAPDITINCPDNYYFNDKMTMKFSVKDIEYTDRKISKLIIVDRFNNEVYNWSANTTTQYPAQSSVNTTEQVTEKAVDIPNNEQKLKQYLIDNKTEENEEQLKKFVTYYIKKDFKGNMDINKLWQLWWNKYLSSKNN
jgi:hypothetical protein